MTSLSEDQGRPRCDHLLVCERSVYQSVTVHSRPFLRTLAKWAENHKDVGASSRDTFVDGQNYI